jgi:hypothetical protein
VLGPQFRSYDDVRPGGGDASEPQSVRRGWDLPRLQPVRERRAAILDVDVADLASRSRQSHIVEARRLIITLGRERWTQRTKDLASALEWSADTVTYIQREGVSQRLDDREFLRRHENLDKALIGGG